MQPFQDTSSCPENQSNNQSESVDEFQIIQRIKAVLEDTSLEYSERCLLAHLMLAAGKKGHWTQSHTVTAAKLGMTARNVQYITAKLESKNLLRRNQRGHYRANQFLMPWHPDFDGDTKPISCQDTKPVSPIKEVLPKDTTLKTDTDGTNHDLYLSALDDEALRLFPDLPVREITFEAYPETALAMRAYLRGKRLPLYALQDVVRKARRIGCADSDGVIAAVVSRMREDAVKPADGSAIKSWGWIRDIFQDQYERCYKVESVREPKCGFEDWRHCNEVKAEKRGKPKRSQWDDEPPEAFMRDWNAPVNYDALPDPPF